MDANKRHRTLGSEAKDNLNSDMNGQVTTALKQVDKCHKHNAKRKKQVPQSEH